MTALRPHARYLDNLYVVAAVLVVCHTMFTSAHAMWRTKRWKYDKYIVLLSLVLLVAFLIANAALLILAFLWDRPLVMDPWLSSRHSVWTTDPR